MKYSEARSEIKSGDLLAWGHERWGSWYDFKVQAVRMFTRSEYCHVAVAWVVAGRVLVLEAVQPRIRIFPLSSLLPFYWVPLRTVWTEEAEQFALERVGEPYSEWQGVLAYLGRLGAGQDRLWQCAEYALEVLENASVPLAAPATPSAVVRAAQALPGTVLHFVEVV